MSGSGICYLVGAGPGDVGLFTLRAKELIEQADVLVYDYLASPEALNWVKQGAECIYAGKKAKDHTLTQGEINELIVKRTQAGQMVVRLKGGDPYVFGRGGEEGQELRAAGVDFEVVPGVTSAIATAAYAGIPVTHRDHNACLTLLTGHEDPAREEQELSKLDWEAMVRSKATLAIYMGVGRMGRIMSKLQECGMRGDVPVAVIQWGTTERHRSVVGTVETIAQKCEREKLGSPAMMVVGSVVNLKPELNWFEDRGRKPLRGKRIVLTRTRKQASRLGKLFREKGAEVLEIPTIRIEETSHESEVKGKDFTDYDWLVFTSPNGVEYFFNEYFRERDLRELAGIKIAVVGPATRDKIQALRIKVDFQPEVYTAAGLVEGWEESENGKKVLFVCGNLAGGEVEKGLGGRGCQVTRLEVYRNVPELEDVTGHRRRFCEEGADWLIFASSSAVENFKALNLSYPEEGLCHASLGPVTSEAMKKSGYSVDYEAEVSKMEVLVRGVIQRS